MTGRPDLSGYKLRYSSGGAWADWTHAGTGIVATIDELSPDTSYDVQVRAINDEGESGWSHSGVGSTFATDDPCLEVGPTPTVVAVTSVPIVVASTTDVYFVLYVTHELDGAEVLTPVAVVVGKPARPRSARTWKPCPLRVTGWSSTTSPTRPTSTATVSTT